MIGFLLSGSVLILVVIALRRLLRGRVSLTLQYAMWILVVFRLLIPFEIGSSSLSLQNFFREEPVSNPAILSPTPQKDPVVLPTPLPSEAVPTQTLPPASVPSQNAEPIPSATAGDPSPIPDAPYEPLPVGLPLSWERILTLFWALGATATALWFLTVNLRFHRRVQKNARPIEVDGYPFLVFINAELSSPCLVGLFRPRVYIPRETDNRTLRHILIHEQTHHRHWDPLWAGVRGLCLCLYWFHPLVWWAAILSRQDCELACDEGALKELGEQERIPYGDTLLSMISHASRPQELFRTATTMAASKKQLKERMEMIVKQPRKLWISLLCLLLVIAITVVCTFTGAKEKKAPSIATSTTETTEPALPTGADSLEKYVITDYEEGTYRIPAFTQAVPNAKTMNEEIRSAFASVSDEDAAVLASVDYECYLNDNILSLLIKGESRSSVPLYVSYNIDITTGDPAQIGDPEVINQIRPLMLVRDLIERYMEAGSFSLPEGAHEILKRNLCPYYDHDAGNTACLWLDGTGEVRYSFCYYPLDGSAAIRHTVSMEDYRPPANPWTESPKAVELLSYRGLEGFGLPDSERPLCHIPFLLAPGPHAMELNVEVLTKYITAYDGLEYYWNVNGDICSLLIRGNRDDLEYSVHVLSYSTGEILAPEEIYTAAGYNRETYMSAAKEAIQNYFFTYLSGGDLAISKGTYDYLAAASGGASNVALSKPYMDENGELWIMGRVFQVAGSSYRWYPIPMEGLPLSQGYLNFLSLPRTELTLTPGFNLNGYSIESLPSGNPLGLYASPSDFQFGSDAIYIDPYPSGQGGPVYAHTPELSKAKEEHLHRYLALLLGAGNYSFQYDETFSDQSPYYKEDDLCVFGNAHGVTVTVPADTPLTELTVQKLSKIPVLEAALRFTGIQAPVIQQRITYEATIDPTDGTVKDYRYTVTEASEQTSPVLTLCEAISITYTPGTDSLHIRITDTPEPTRVATTPIPTGVDFMEAVGNLTPFTDRYLTGYVECYYSSQAVLGYYVPCYRIYIQNEVLTEQYGIPTYTVYDLCDAAFPTNRTEVLPWSV